MPVIGVQSLTAKTESEALFETFCAAHCLDWAPHGTRDTPTPDYKLNFAGTTVCVEIKQIESEVGFVAGGLQSRTVGEHVRRKITEAKAQLQAASHAGFPTILLIYNTVDPLQAFGTESQDFTFAMYGEWTVSLADGQIEDSFHGRNSSLRPKVNTSFSALGQLRRTRGGAEVKIFENAYARHPLPYDALPECFEVVRIEIEYAV